MSKIVVPESEQSKTMGISIAPHYERENNLFEAIINGANSGLKVIAGIVALLIAVLGMVALLDMVVSAIGTRLNPALGIHLDWTLKGLLGYLFYPLTLCLGIPPSDAVLAAQIIGERAVLTEVTAYQDLSAAISTGTLHNPRSALIIAYALCGFAHVASLSIFVGATAALAPGRTQTLSRIALRALVAATLACLMTACVAGTFFNNHSILLR
jgi:CNT family concentrative nucleoside transporter